MENFILSLFGIILGGVIYAIGTFVPSKIVFLTAIVAIVAIIVWFPISVTIGLVIGIVVVSVLTESN